MIQLYITIKLYIYYVSNMGYLKKGKKSKNHGEMVDLFDILFVKQLLACNSALLTFACRTED